MDLRPASLDSPLNRRVRVFIGIGPAPAEWAEALSLWTSQLAPRLERFGEKPIQWTQPENLHLTLRFMGSITQEEILRVTERIQTITQDHTAFAMRSAKLALFPHPSNPRVAAVEMEEPSGQLSELEDAIRYETAKFGNPPEEREFCPHVTFARLPDLTSRDPFGHLDPAYQAKRLIASLWLQGEFPILPEWPVTHLTLFKSEPHKGGSIYSAVSRFKLG